jgi:hypothetical protein
MLTLALHAALQQRQPGYYAASRSWLVLVFKLLLTAVLMSLVVTCVLEPIHTVGSYVKVLLMGSGIVMLNCTGKVQGYMVARTHLCGQGVACMHVVHCKLGTGRPAHRRPASTAIKLHARGQWQLHSSHYAD